MNDLPSTWRPWQPCQCLIAVLTAFLVIEQPSRLLAQEDSRASTKDPTAQSAVTAEQVQTLIEKLGSDKFQERENASAALLAVGEPALLPLMMAERDRDAEVSHRAQMIRTRVERDRFEKVAIEFKRDPDPTASYGLPGWKAFSEAAGTSRPAKRLFLRMLERRRLFALCLESLEGGQVPAGVFDGLPDDPQQRLKMVVGKTCSDIRHQLLVAGISGDPGDLIAMLVAVQILKDPPADLHDSIRLQCNMNSLNSLMLLPGAMPTGRKLIGGWFALAPTTYCREIFNLGRLYQVPEARLMAIRVLKGATDDEAKSYALLSLSQFGTLEDLPLIDKFVDDKTPLGAFLAPIMGNVRVEQQAPRGNGQANPPAAMTYDQTLGDYAVVAGCRILHIELEPLFPVIRVDDVRGVAENTVGFPHDRPALRANAIKVYKEQREKNNNPPAS